MKFLHQILPHFFRLNVIALFAPFALEITNVGATPSLSTSEPPPTDRIATHIPFYLYFNNMTSLGTILFSGLVCFRDKSLSSRYIHDVMIAMGHSVPVHQVLFTFHHSI